MVKVSATEIAEFDMLEMLTPPLIRIQFWRVGRETPQENFLRPTTGEEIFHLVGTTDTPAIPNHQTQLRPHNYQSAFTARLFFRSGQTAVRQCSIAFSLRSRRAA
jgi:hypothetical protein